MTISPTSKDAKRLINWAPFFGDDMINKYHIEDGMRERLDNDYQYHSPNEDQQDRYILIRAEARKFAETILRNTPKSREQSLALTYMDQVVFAANSAIARNE